MFNALIRTHHITSRKKVVKLKQAATTHNVFALLRSGGSPGIMYVEGDQRGVREWVESVHKLRYKDYQLASRPAPLERETGAIVEGDHTEGLHEVGTVKEFGIQMQLRGVFDWWRKAMGFTDKP